MIYYTDLYDLNNIYYRDRSPRINHPWIITIIIFVYTESGFSDVVTVQRQERKSATDARQVAGMGVAR